MTISADCDTIGPLLHRKSTEAEIQVVAHQKYPANFTNALPDPTLVAEWTELVCDWEQDRSKPMPYLSVEERESPSMCGSSKC